MEFLDGLTLKHRIARRSMKLELILSLTIEITDALDALRAKGNIHRDVKPANILILRCHSKSFSRTSSAMNSARTGCSPS
jgi:hypothetical protein